jgi:hypothetical protein
MSMQTSPAEAGATAHILRVGQDGRGRWMVQENHGLIEGLFVSREAALHFARLERHAFPGARVELAAGPLVSTLAA